MGFPKDFLWGSASAAYQIEGAALLDGKGLSIWDVYSHEKGNTFKDTNGDVAIDFYHRYEEDIKLMAEMGLKAYRFSISWPRILPKGKGETNKVGIKFYHNVIDCLIKHNIEPIVTLYHWDLPQALYDEYKGFESRNIIDDFKNYSKIVFEEYGKKVKYFVTLNEQNVFTSLGYLYKTHPPKKNDANLFYNVNHNAFLANAAAIDVYKSMNLDGMIGPSFAYGPAYPKSCNPFDMKASEDALELNNYLWLDVYLKGFYSNIQLKLLEKIGVSLNIKDGDKELLLKGIPDFIGVNYYSTNTFSKEKEESDNKKIENTVISEVLEYPTDKLFYSANNPYVKKTDWNWVIDPIGLNIALRRITSRYDLPILITENGLGAYDKLENGEIHDEYRISYLKEHIDEIRNAIDEGVNVLGYCSWSFQDLFSWLNGYQKRYGFVYVDRDELSERTLNRYKKDSFYFYKNVIGKNGDC